MLVVDRIVAGGGHVKVAVGIIAQGDFLTGQLLLGPLDQAAVESASGRRLQRPALGIVGPGNLRTGARDSCDSSWRLKKKDVF